MQINTIEWTKNKENKLGLLENIKTLLALILHKITVAHKLKLQDVKIPQLYLGDVSQRVAHTKEHYIPSISERKENYIVFYYEILKEFIEEVKDDNEISKFVESVCLHEYMHIFLNHKTDSEEVRQQAETEVNMWMRLNAPEMQDTFCKYMPLIDKIGKKYEKIS